MVIPTIFDRKVVVEDSLVEVAACGPNPIDADLGSLDHLDRYNYSLCHAKVSSYE